MNIKKYIRKLRYVPRFIVDKEFRAEIIRRRLYFGTLVWLTRHPFPHIRTITVNDGKNDFTLDPRDRGTTLALVVWGHLDHDNFLTSLDLAKKEGMLKDKGNIFVDVGANIGTHTVYAMNTGKFERVIAIEPHAGNFSLLQKNVRDNGLEGKVGFYNCAMGRENGWAEFEVSAEHSGDHRVRLEQSGKNAPQAMDEGKREVVKVEQRTLDSLIREQGITDYSSLFISIDVQGFEAFILDGAHELIKGGAVFCIEFWPYGLRYANAVEYLNELIRDNFDAYYDVGRGLDGARENAGDIAACYARYPGRKFTDLLLVQGDRHKSEKKVA